MKISLKLPLAFAVALGLLFAGAMFGIYRLNLAVSAFQDDVLREVASHQTSAEISTAFATAIQEWKNVLLRGKDPKDLDKYWTAHTREMARVDELLKTLDRQVVAGTPIQTQAQHLRSLMTAAQAGYGKAFEAYKAAGFDPTAGDRAARGVDRAAAAALSELRHALSASEATASEAANAQARSANRLALLAMVLVTAISLTGAIWLSRQITAPLGDAAGIADRVAHGDLSASIRVGRGDEVGALLESLRFMQSSLSRLVANVRHSSEGVATASAEIASGNSDLSARTESQASALEQTTASMKQLGATVRQNADNARQANQLAHNASEVALQGGAVVSQVVETMKGINEASRQIADIIGVIDGIAFQTNILALNAAVEAARAGEQGRGFAVVAAEVRSLAQRSAQAAKEIKSLIGASVDRVERGTTLVDEAGATMTKVVNAIQRVNDIVAEITSASSEQAEGVAQVGKAVSQMDEATQQNAALVEQMAAAATSLKSQAADMVQMMAAFKVAPGAHAAIEG